jgi:hypothetical protein
MALEVADTVATCAEVQADGKRPVSTWPVPVDRNQAITALTMTELLHQGYLDGQALLAALRDELS